MEDSQGSSFTAGSHVLLSAEKFTTQTHEIYPTISFDREVSAVTKRNERERNRVRLVNEGFTCLRQKIPFAHGRKRLSKVETLRYAVDYIKHLQCVIQEHDEQFSDDAMERERMLRLQGHDSRVTMDVNEGLSDSVIEKPGRKAMFKLMSSRAQERWKMLTDNGRKIGAAHAQPILRPRIRKENTGEEGRE
jgi:hypothetical protein